MAQTAAQSSSKAVVQTFDSENIIEDKFDDIKFLFGGDDDEEEDLPELLVSGCGLKSADGLYCFVKGAKHHLKYSRIGIGAEFEIHYRMYSRVYFWTIEYKNIPLRLQGRL